VQEAGYRSVGEKRRKLAMEFLNITIRTPPNSKKVRAFSCLSWLKTFLDALYIPKEILAGLLYS